MGMRLSGWIVLLAMLCVPYTVHAQDDSSVDEAREQNQLFRQIGQLVSGFRQLGDWEPHHELAVQAAENIYRSNGWTSPADEYSLDLLREVSAIPPWQPLERIELLTGNLQTRYRLTDRQAGVLRRIIIRENNRPFLEHATEIVPIAMEAIQTRASGEPFTADQVARWTESMSPILLDQRARLDEVAGEFLAELDPSQQRLVREDLVALSRRADTMLAKSEEWAAGNWNAAEWGLEDDPIQNGDSASVASSASRPGARDGREGAVTRGNQSENPVRQTTRPRKTGVANETPTRAAATDTDAWKKYVEDFIARYTLNDPQTEQAWRHYRRQSAQRDRVLSRFNQQIETQKERAGSTASVSATTAIKRLEQQRDTLVENLFGRLKQGLDSIPTPSQKAAAAPAPREPSNRATGPSLSGEKKSSSASSAAPSREASAGSSSSRPAAERGNSSADDD